MYTIHCSRTNLINLDAALRYLTINYSSCSKWCSLISIPVHLRNLLINGDGKFYYFLSKCYTAFNSFLSPICHSQFELRGHSGNPAWKNNDRLSWNFFSKETMIHFGTQFSHTDLFILKFAIFFLTKLMKVAEIT